MSLHSFRLRRLLPLAAFLIFSGIAYLLWQDRNDQDRELILRHTETSSEQIKIRIEGLMNARIASLEIMADRWVERQPPDFGRERFMGFAETLFKHYLGFSAVFWLDPDGRIQWVFPREQNAAVVGKSIDEFGGGNLNFGRKKPGEGGGIIALPCVKPDDGKLGFHILKPLVLNGEIQGYLDGVFDVDRIVDVCLGPGLVKEFDIQLYEGDQLIYRNGILSRSAENRKDLIQVSKQIGFDGKHWSLTLINNEIFGILPLQNKAFLIFGLTLSAFLALLIHFLLQRMAMYKDSRDLALREIDERKEVQEALRANEKKLEALLAELSAKNLELESFVYTVSHDLRTPIVTIEGFIGALREDYGDSISENGEKYLKYMSDAARKMESLINDLLNLSRIGRVVERKREFPFAEPLEEALATLRPLIEARGIKIVVREGLPTVYGERKRIAQVMDNLLNNAVKYIGNENPAPRIDVGFEEKNGRKVFFVRDNGIGIEARYFGKIFQLFERLPAAKRVGDGTGIGLTIVKRIIEHHGGEIWLTSEPGKGTTFHFTLQEKESENDS
jgi:signal transduction histidine kinase